MQRRRLEDRTARAVTRFFLAVRGGIRRNLRHIVTQFTVRTNFERNVLVYIKIA